ncbi:PP2C, putative [Perkinsus marinus ATCC 50983]|uniref:PP2C, putative n=1 Tax=Perkinsus marinus (strain ATCC 50983 / TXsc) TaxID=423536 RepID=C5K8A4_PERM5|nr:PP2C, putative [Perkinsus marinus ATCC 50983]EER19292.1 PP2C, putative [Perkinsus marinus ATCC 50983]|eukprot:XP_002787496.1 PP2C, putative [Perkinsus marinus ATCC 50983]
MFSTAASIAEDSTTTEEANRAVRKTYIREKHFGRLTLSQSEAVAHKETTERRGLVRQVTRRNLIDLFPDSIRRFSLLGKPSDANQRGFDNKRTEALGGSDITDYRVGYACKKGLKPESPNQDDFFVIGIDELGMFGVFDGHGPYGHDVSSFCHDALPGLLIKDEEFYTEPTAAFTRAFKDTHLLCEQASSRGKFDCSLSGTTATVVMTRDETIYCAWVGDSRAVIGTTNADGEIIAEDLSRDHKPERPDEKSRISSRGGQVRKLEGDIPYRVFLKGKLYPGLAMSRSLGDSVGASAGITYEPEIRIRKIDRARDRFVVLCSDGVWEFITSQMAVELINRYTPGEVQTAAEALAQEAWKRWIQEEGNVVDDITVVVAWLDEVVVEM